VTGGPVSTIRGPKAALAMPWLLGPDQPPILFTLRKQPWSGLSGCYASVRADALPAFENAALDRGMADRRPTPQKKYGPERARPGTARPGTGRGKTGKTGQPELSDLRDGWLAGCFTVRGAFRPP
jgi:hypothetical protein